MPAHPNRVDLNNPANRQQYGDKKKLADAQRAVPVASSPNAPVVRPVPGERGSLTRPTERPTEPITAGAPFGPGVGPQGAGIPTFSPQMSALDEVRVVAQQYGLPELQDLLDAYGSET